MAEVRRCGGIVAPNHFANPSSDTDPGTPSATGTESANAISARGTFAMPLLRRRRDEARRAAEALDG